MRRIVRALYSRIAAIPLLQRPLAAVRASPRVRAFARRHVDLLLADGTTWANVDGALRLLAEDRGRPVVFGQWPGDRATELLYWLPFVRWAQERFSIDPDRLTILCRSGTEYWYREVASHCSEADARWQGESDASFFPAEPVNALVEEYRRGVAAPRPLLKRMKDALLGASPDGEGTPSSSGYVAFDLGPTAGFPDSEANRALAASLTQTLTATRSVIELDRLQPLERRHTIIAQSSGLVSGYSELTLLGVCSQIPVVALRANGAGVAETDLDFAQRLATGLGGSLTILDTRDAADLAAAFARS